MERFGIIDLKKAKARNYEKFYLKRNPFPAIGIPEETPFITVDRETVIKRFQNAIGELLETGKSIVTVMVGEYGSGKSHLLRLFKNSVNMQLLSSEGTLAVYIKTPGEDFSYFFQGFIDGVGPDLLTQLSSKFIIKCMKSEQRLLKHVIGEEAKKKFQYPEVRVQEVLHQLRILDLINDLKASKFSKIDSDLAQTILSMADPKFSSISWKWLLGEHLDIDEKGLINVSTSFDPKETYRLFCDFVKLLQEIGVKNLVILVDELEKITLLQRTKKAKYQDDLRTLIDDHPTNVCFYFAIAPRQWQDLTMEPTALVRRLKGNWYLLEDFKESETKELIEKYLFSARFDQYPAKQIQNSFPSCEPSMFPFTKESVEIISKESRGVVSDILLICRKALELLCDTEEYSVITRELVEYAIGKK